MHMVINNDISILLFALHLLVIGLIADLYESFLTKLLKNFFY